MSAHQPNDQLRSLRINRKVSRVELAAYVEVSSTLIGRWERGETQPSQSLLRKLCVFFQCTPAALGFSQLSSDTMELHSAPSALIHDPAIPLPPSIGLVGREQILFQLKQRLLQGGGNASTSALNGLPGVGKTTIAVAIAHDAEIKAHFKDGVLWAGLGPAPDIPGQLRHWGSLLGLSETQMNGLEDTEAWSKALRNAIGPRSFLVVIDDAWNLEDALVFKVGGSFCAHLVTTRFPSISTQLTTDGALLLQELNVNESLALLKLLAPDIPGVEVQGLGDLALAVGGLPLALSLMGNYLRTQGYRGSLRRIQAAFQQLGSPDTRLQLSQTLSPTEHHPSLPLDASLSLQTIIAVTDQRLREATRDAFYILGLFPAKPNSFSEAAMLASADCTLDEIDDLCDAGLLECSQGERYILHQVLADYARLHLSPELKLQGATRLMAYIITYMETHKREYEALEQESSLMHKALNLAHELGLQAEFVRGVCLFAPFLLLRGFYATANQYLAQAYDISQHLHDEHGQMASLLYQGEVLLKYGDYDDAEKRLQSSLRIAQRLGNDEYTSDIFTQLGTLAWRRGNYVSAEAYLHEGLTLARILESYEQESSILRILGSVVGNQGKYDQAETYFREGLVLAQRVANREHECILLGNLGVTFAERGDAKQAESYFQQTLNLARQIGHREQVCVMLINLGSVAGSEENYEQALIYLGEGLALLRQMGHRLWQCVALSELGAVVRKQGKYEQAEAYLQESLLIARQMNQPRVMCTSLNEYGNLYLDQHNVEVARTKFVEMLTWVVEGDQEMRALANYGLARVALALGDIQEARRLGLVSHTVLREIGHLHAKEVGEWLGALDH